MSTAWSVTYETATIRTGIAPTQEEAERAAVAAHDSYVIKGLNPDALAWHVKAPFCTRCLRHHAREGEAEEKCQEVSRFVNADHRRRGGTI